MNLYSNTEDKSDDLQAIKLLQTSRTGRVLARWLLGTMTLVIIVLFLPWRQTIRGSGTITAYTPADRPQTVNSIIDGRIEQWFVQEGQAVKAGDSLIRISEVKEKYFDPQILMRLGEQLIAKKDAADAYTRKIEALNEQIAALESGRRLSLEKAQNVLQQASFKVSADSAGLEAAKMQVYIADTQYKRAQVLYNQGLKSLTDAEAKRMKLQESQAKLSESQNKLLTSRNERINAKIELSSLGADYAEKIAKAASDKSSAQAYLNDLEGTIAKLENEVSSTEIRQGYYTIRAPRDGFVVRALKFGRGEMVKSGDPVVTIMPENSNLAVELYVSAYDLPLLNRGNEVRIQFDGWPALQFTGWPGASFGTFGGKVAVIDYMASEKNNYRVLIVPDPEDEPWPKQLRVGSGAMGWALLNRVPVWYEIWRQMNGFPPSFYENIKQESGEQKTDKKDAKFLEEEIY